MNPLSFFQTACLRLVLTGLLPFAAFTKASATGTWTSLPAAPGLIGLMMLQADGTVMAFNSGSSSKAVYKLTPASNGKYSTGTWSTLTSMYDGRLYYSSQVLKDGRVFVAGGEYGSGLMEGETYNPLTNSWTKAPSSGQRFSDANSALIPDGRVLVALVSGSLKSTTIFDPVANTWTAGPTCNGIHNESAWMRLQDESVLMVARNSTSSERYIPATNSWITDATVPVSLYDPYGLETGGALMLPNGKAFFIGSLGHNAIYTPSGSTANGTWVAAADTPGSNGAPDAPCCILPNGKVLAAVSPVPTSADHFPSPTTFYEYDYLTDSWTLAPTPGGTQNHSSYFGTMLVLPDGTALYSNFGSTVYNYTPDGTPITAGRPVITSVTQNSNGTFHLVGTQLNGWSEGSSYGDDNQNPTNYPIVRLTSGATVYHARSFNWSSNGVMTGATPVSTEFFVPGTVPNGTYDLTVVANGISSDPVVFTINPIAITLPASVTENGSAGSGTVTLTSAPASDTVVTLTSANTAKVTVPASVTVLAGQTSATFAITPGNDAILSGKQAIGISAAAAGYQTGFNNLIVIDDDTAVLAITPSTTFSSSGGAGGPFSPSSNVYTLNNTGNTSLTWTAAKTQTWLTLSPTSGTIAGGGNATVTATINSGANTLATGSYTDTITFTNTATGDGSTTRAVSLSVSGTPAMSVTAGALVSTGAQGGAFTPASTSFTINNPGTATLSYTVAKTATWLTLSSTSGTVAAGGSTTITASINTTNANALSAGAYSDTITFTNTSNGNGNTTRAASLLVQAKVSSNALTTNPGWAIQGEWAFGTPTGSGGPPNGNADPTAGSTGSNVFGVNLAGNYSTTPGGPFYLTTTAFNCSTSTQTKLKFQRWLNTDAQPFATATVEVSNNGTTWTQVFANDTGAITDSAWQPVTYDISAVADSQGTVFVRWGYSVTAGALAYSGWNIDDVDVLGNVNRLAPTATAQSQTVTFGTTKAITLAGADTNSPTGAPLSFAIATQPAHGTVSGTPPAVSYTPALGYSGADSFTFTATNLYGITSTPATVSLTVTPGAPIATPKSVTVAPDTPTAITLTGVDPNIPPQPLTFTTTTSPTHGALSGSAPNLTYTPVTGYTGSDTFNFTVNNGTSTSAAAAVTIKVGVVNVVEPVTSTAVINGTKPTGVLVVGADGALYGTCQTGGINNQGSVFKITTAGVLTTLVNFTGANGAVPQAGLCLANDGNFYGTTTVGGANNLGTIFKMTPAGVLTTLVNLTSVSPATGTVPKAALVQAPDGNLYGTTTASGAGNGTLFRCALDGTFTLLQSFTGTTGSVLGSNCQAAMIVGLDGNLYGVAGGGGGGGFGTVFKMTTAGVFTTLVNFTGSTGAALGSVPLGALVQGSDGTLYGTTSATGASANGTIFKCTTAGVLTTLQSFTGSTGAVIGGSCQSPLVIAADGVTLYGTASAGSTYGSLFQITTAGVFTNLKTIASTDGPSTPLGGMTLAGDGNYYGTLSGNVANVGATRGGIFKLVPGTSTFSVLSSFQLKPPVYRNLVKHSDNNLYATTTQGGTNLYGSVVKLTPAGVLTTLTSFTSASGTTNPNTLTIGTDNNLYGTNPSGVALTNGGLFKLTTGGTLTTLASFTGTTGAVLGTTPSAPLTAGGDGNYYGVTSGGGTGGFGTVFKVTTTGTFTSLGSFTSTTGALLGSSPNTRLVLAGDGNLYGTTTSGGTGGFGTIFRVNVSTGIVTSLISFTSTTGAALGSSPNTNLVLGADGKLYGTTNSGGTGSNGTVYSFTTAGVLTTLVNFTGTSGAAPGSSPATNLIFGSDGVLYGTTTGGGASSSGTVYSCTTSGVFTSLTAFTGSTGVMPGSVPSSMLVQSPDGWLYGTTGGTGLYTMGTLYRVHPSGMAQVLYAFGSAADGGVATNTSTTSLSLGYRLVLGADGYLYGGNNGTIFRVHQQPAMQSQPAGLATSTTEATLSASVVPNNDVATAYFEYGLTAAYGTQTATQNVAAGSTPITLTADLSALIPGQVYHFRLVTVTSQGTFYSTDQTFATPGAPIAITGSWTGAAQSGISVNGLVNPLGSLTSYWFEYGETTDYDDTTPPQVLESQPLVLDAETEPDGPQNLSNGIAMLPVQVSITEGITPGTVFHIRLVAENSYGRTYGDDQVITTFSPQSSAVVEPMFQYTGTGTSPQAGLTLANDGSFYGVTNTGGSINGGTAFKLTQGGTMTTLASFYGTAGSQVFGSSPQGALIQGPNGNLYGTTNSGGTTGNGTIFMMTPSGTMTTLVNFTGTTGAALGAGSVSKLTLGLDGNFYGTTTAGGTVSGNGTIFMMTPAGVLTTLVNFTGATGVALGTSPRGLLLANDGNFYGVTNTGGTSSLGTIFKVTPAGVLTTLVSFTGTTGAALGSGPNCALIQGSDGNLYGTTAGGGTLGFGTVFVVTPAGTLTTLVQFTGTAGAALGSSPKGALIQLADGDFYGTTTTGGTAGGNGTLFKMTNAGVLTTLINFTGATGTAPGATPQGALVLGTDGSLYGMTAGGGAFSQGTAFKCTTIGLLTTLVHLNSPPVISHLIQGSDGTFFGTMIGGGSTTGNGVYFNNTIDGAPRILTQLVPTSGTTAISPRGGLLRGSDGNLYGTSNVGGANNLGSLFKATESGVVTTMISFTGNSGVAPGTNPQSALIQGADGNYWGTTNAGGSTTSVGEVFKMTPAGVISTVAVFTGSTGAVLGSNPQGPLILASDGNYYGTTAGGGTSSLGTVFKLTPAGAFTSLVSFNNVLSGVYGSTPLGAMVQGPDGALYGVTSTGGTGNFGTVFKITLAGVFTHLASFTGTSGTLLGTTPNGGLFTGPDGHFYGVTFSGGVYGVGTLFRVNNDGSVQSLYSFTGRNEGINSQNGLLSASDGFLYGQSSAGIFRVHPTPAALALPATGISATSATLNGSITGEAYSGTTWFEYGLTTSYGATTSAQSFTAGNAAAARQATITVQPFLTYHYRMVASTSGGVFNGPDRTFTTPSTTTFNAATDVPVTVRDFTATGQTLSFSLGFAPATGTVLQLVNNTGPNAISGLFTGLPEGSAVTGLFGATPYLFQISYAGGDGNDITLTATTQVITFPAIGVKRTTDAPFALKATASSGLAVSYQIVAGGTSATLSGGTVTLTGTAGAVTIKATQAGDGGSIGAAIPVYQSFTVTTESPFVQISSSKINDFSLGIRADGTLWAWGLNSSGQLGDNTTTTRRTPVQIGTATDWTRVVCGSAHTIGLRGAGGDLYAWGSNSSGQLGDNTTTTRFAPVLISSGWAAIAAGTSHTVAVTTAGTLWAWGSNASGQIGQNSILQTTYLVPTQIGSATTWSTSGQKLSVGSDFTFAIDTAGKLYAWGLNTSGQLGNGGTANVLLPAQIGSATTWQSVCATTSSGFATMTDGTLNAWGINSSGQVGDNTLTNRSSPVVIGTGDWAGSVLGAGATHCFARKTNGTLWSWGLNTFGNLGQGFADAVVRANVPTQVGTSTGWTAVAGGAGVSHAIASDGSLHSWGSINNSVHAASPRPWLPVAPQFGPVINAAASVNTTYMIKPDGSLWAVGTNGSGQLGIGLGGDNSQHPYPVQMGLGFVWRQVAAGSGFMHAIRADGTLWACGTNSSSQLGDGTTVQRNVLVQIGTDADWKFVVDGNNYTLAIKNNGTLWAWGANNTSQLGDGTAILRSSPVQIGTETNWLTVCAANNSSGFCAALKTDGTLWTWGNNANGQLGDGTTTTAVRPAKIGTATDWTALVAGSSHVLALKSNGTLWAWGLNSSNQLGDGTSTQRTAPVQIGTATNWSSIGTGSASCYGMRTDGSLYVWGTNPVFQLGTATYSGFSSPTRLGTSNAWRSLPVQSSSAVGIALTIDGTLWSAGLSNSGQNGFAGRNHWIPERALPGLSATIQSMTLALPPTASVGVSFSLGSFATTTSGLPSSYTVTGPATLNGEQLTITGPGTVTVVAWQPGNSVWQSSNVAHGFINLAAPTVTTLAASSVGTTTATLNAVINPNGSSTTAQFQRGTTTGYGTNTAITLAPSNDIFAQNATLVLTGLTPGTTYHYRATATSTQGTTNGADVIFRTIGIDASLASITLSAGTLSPVFASGTTSYTAVVPNTAASLTVTPVTTDAFATFTLNGGASTTVPLDVGVNNLSIAVTAQDGVSTSTYTIAVTRRTAFEDWAVANNVSTSGNINTVLLGDSDNDGVSNLVEWAFGLDGTTSSTTTLVVNGATLNARGAPSVQQDLEGGRVAVFGRRMDYLAAGLTYVVEFSPDLLFWEASSATPTSLANDGLIEAVSVPYPATVNGQPTKFFRVRVTKLP